VRLIRKRDEDISTPQPEKIVTDAIGLPSLDQETNLDGIPVEVLAETGVRGGYRKNWAPSPNRSRTLPPRSARRRPLTGIAVPCPRTISRPCTRRAT
jgi:hypothetical protein